MRAPDRVAALQPHADEHERGAQEHDEQRGAGERDRQHLVDVAHDGALGPDDLDGRRRDGGRATGAWEVGRRVADLRGRGERDAGHALIEDVEGEPGALPLLSTCLLDLWQRRDGRVLRLATYQESGGVHAAVARLAEGAYGRLGRDGQRMARGVLLRLAGEGEGEAVVRARVALDEFGDEVRPVLDVLTDSRLLTVSEGEVEVAHEALLREWPRLRGWLEDDAEGRRLHRHLRAAASEWDAGGRDRSELYRGARLAAARDWAADHDPELAARERTFLDESVAASERAHRRLRMVLAGVAALLVVAAVIAGAIALNERANARHEAVAADAQRVGAQALSADDLDRSLLLARQGVALDDSLQTRGNLLAALLKSPAAIGVVRGDGDGLVDVDLSPDGGTLAFMEGDGTLRFVDARMRRVSAPPVAVPGQAPCTIAALLRFDQLHYSPDGSRIAIGGCRPVILDAATHRVIAHLQFDRDALVYGLRFSPDGRTLYAVRGSDRGAIVLRFDGRTGRRLSGVARMRADGFVTAIPTPDGRALVTAGSAEGGTVVRDARTLRALRRIPAGAQYTALSPNGHTLLLGGADGSVRFADLRTGTVRLATGRHNGVVERGIFSADGRFAITAATDHQIIQWDVRHATEGEVLTGHHGRITQLAITRDDSTLYSSALDGEVLIWDLKGTHRIGRPLPVKVGLDRFGQLPRYALSPDGRILVVGRPDGKVGVFDMRTLRRLWLFPVVPSAGAAVAGMAWIPRSALIVVGGDDGFARGRRSAAPAGRQASPRPHRARLDARDQRGRAPDGDRRKRLDRPRLVAGFGAGDGCAAEVSWRHRRCVDEPRRAHIRRRRHRGHRTTRACRSSTWPPTAASRRSRRTNRSGSSRASPPTGTPSSAAA